MTPEREQEIREALAVWGKAPLVGLDMSRDLLAALDAEREARACLRFELDGLEHMRVKDNGYLISRAETAEAALAEAREALEQIAAQRPKTLTMIEANGFIFDSIGREPGNWQHLAFTIYTDLCEVDSIARTSLASASEGETA